MRSGRWAVLAVVMTAGTLAGCSSGAGTRSSAAHAKARATPRVDARDVAVIRGWSDALRRGDVAGAARYFALPSVMINGPDANGQVVAVNISTTAEAEAANASLPCGARLVSTVQQGRYINALFSLTERPGPGGGCSTGAGQTARTNFVIRHGRIVDWIRAPSQPGDNPSPSPVTPASGAPGAAV